MLIRGKLIAVFVWLINRSLKIYSRIIPFLQKDGQLLKICENFIYFKCCNRNCKSTISMNGTDTQILNNLTPHNQPSPTEQSKSEKISTKSSEKYWKYSYAASEKKIWHSIKNNWLWRVSTTEIGSNQKECECDKIKNFERSSQNIEEFFNQKNGQRQQTTKNFRYFRNQVFLLFVTDQWFAFLSWSECVHANGTFKTTPKPFMQTYFKKSFSYILI